MYSGNRGISQDELTEMNVRKLQLVLTCIEPTHFQSTIKHWFQQDHLDHTIRLYAQKLMGEAGFLQDKQNRTEHENRLAEEYNAESSPRL